MAVFKSSNCYPFLNSVDIRVAKTAPTQTYPAEYLKCKSDSSNKQITGYSIRVLDESGNQIFPLSTQDIQISPITELQTGQMANLYEANGLNSGVNGTYLQIPFFQTFNEKKLNSVNAVYYKPYFMVDRIILNDALADAFDSTGVTLGQEINNWTLDSSTGYLTYNWTTQSVVTSEEDTTDVLAYEDDEEEGSESSAEDLNQIYFGDELLQADDVVFVAVQNGASADISKVGFYKASRRQNYVSNNQYTYTTILVPITEWNNLLKETQSYLVTVSKGERFHNSTWKISSKNTIPFDTSTASLWCDYEGNDLEGFSNEGARFSWEITLYQGEGETAKVADAQYPDLTVLDTAQYSSLPSVITYNYIDEKFLDMTISSGTILGSCAERIQIASADPFISGVPNPNAILPGLKTGTLILQTRYMDLTNVVGGVKSIFSGNRTYVQTYDSSYGHVYPISGELTDGMVSNATHVQFFKHSNNEEDITAADYVNWGTSENVVFKWAKIENSSVSIFTSYNSWLNESVTVRYIIVDNLPGLINTAIQEGDTILLMGQQTKYQNGIYSYFIMKDSSGVSYKCLRRASSYQNWSSYIGKIAYCANFIAGSASVATNIECLAGAGSSYTLWNPLEDFTPGDTNLLFTREMPILLFEEKIENGHSYDLFHDVDVSINIKSGKLDASGITEVDGVVPQAGMIILTRGGNVFEVTSSSIWTEITKDSEGNDRTVETRDYCYFSYGENWGKRVLRWPQWPSKDSDKATVVLSNNWDLYTAKILKNNSTVTYLTPFNTLETGMKIKLMQNKKVTIQDNSTTTNSTSWIKVESVNSNLFAIYHGAISGTTPYLTPITNTTNGTPYKYEIRSFFKASDENPFYTYEAPYAVINKNGSQYSSLGTLKSESTGYVDAGTVFGRGIYLTATYKQFQGLDWESYRWVLLDSQGNILQDTGENYDKSISTTFYGLSDDDNTSGTTYYVKLYITDSVGNSVENLMKILVVHTTKKVLPASFYATYDCDINAIKLEYQDNGIVIPSYRSEEDSEVRYDNPYIEGSSLYDGGLIYSSDAGMSILNQQGTDEALFDFYYNSLVDGSDGVKATDKLSYANKAGVAYYTTFSSEKTATLAENSQPIYMQRQENDSSNQGQLYFETEFKLGEDFCGNIVEWSIEGDPEEIITKADPYVMIDGVENSKNGYLVVNLSVPDNIVDTSYDELQDKRNFFKLSVSAERGVDQNTISKILSGSNEDEKKLCEDYYKEKWPLSGIVFIGTYANKQARSKYENAMSVAGVDEVQVKPLVLYTLGSEYYYVQAADAFSEDFNYEKNEFLHFFSSMNSPYIFKSSNGQYYSPVDCMLGTLCLTDNKSVDDTNVYTYWVETNPYVSSNVHLKDFQKSRFLKGEVLQFLKYSDPITGTSDGVTCWPSETEEANFYWEDISKSDITTPINWTEVDYESGGNPYIKRVVALKRHAGIDNYNYHLKFTSSKIKDFYEYLSKGEVLMVQKGATQDESTGNMIFMVNFVHISDLTILGTIMIEQIPNN